MSLLICSRILLEIRVKLTGFICHVLLFRNRGALVHLQSRVEFSADRGHCGRQRVGSIRVKREEETLASDLGRL